MTELYLVRREKLGNYLEELIKSKTGEFNVARSPKGKPYIVGNPLFFSVTHSGNRAAIALADSPVGVDMEVFTKKTHTSVLSRFSQREREEITGEKSFLFHWTAREAFVKMLGGSIWEYIKRLEFYGGEIFVDGIKQNVDIRRHLLGYGVVCVCVQK